jgi:hypothetical protein
MPLNLPLEVWLMLGGAAGLFMSAIAFVLLMWRLVNR